MSNYPTNYSEGTPERVKDILENELHSNNRIRLFYGDPVTGKDWEDEYDMMGYIGKSTGTKPILLIVNNKRCYGGPGILTNCIIKITKNGVTLYQHPEYHHKQHEIIPSDLPEYAEAVTGDGELIARFKKIGQGQKWIDFIEGRRNSK